MPPRADPYVLRFDDFSWTDPVDLRPLDNAVLIGQPIDLDQTLVSFERKVTSNSDDFVNRTILGQLLLRRAKERDHLPSYLESEKELRRALASNPGYIPAKSALAATLMAQHKFSEAHRLLLEIESEMPDRPATLAALFDCSLELGQSNLALGFLKRLQAIENSAPVLARAARLAELAGDRAGALALLDAAIESLVRTTVSSPQSLGWYRWRKGTIQFDLGEIDAALDSFHAVLAAQQHDEPALVGLANVQFAKGDLESAIATLETAAKDKAPPVVSLLGDLYAVSGQLERAEQLWLETESLMREEAKIVKVAHAREVAMFYADHNRNLREALELSELDLNQRQDGFAWDCHAWALYKNSDIENAGKAIEKAMAIVRGDPRVLLHAAAIAAASGRHDEARSYVRQLGQFNSKFSITYARDFQELQNQLSSNH